MQAPSAFLLGEHNVILHRNTKKKNHKWVNEVVWAEKEHL